MRSGVQPISMNLVVKCRQVVVLVRDLHHVRIECLVLHVIMDEVEV